MLSCAFSPTQGEQYLITLVGEGDWCVILWQWDAMKMLAKIDLNIYSVHEEIPFQISLNHIITDLVCVVTGPNMYKYLKTEDNMRSFKEVHSQLRPHGRDDMSSIYTCHCWAIDKVQLIVASATGDIFVCAMGGDFLLCIPDSPLGHSIYSVVPHNRGLIFGGKDGQIWRYESCEEETVLYNPQPLIRS